MLDITREERKALNDLVFCLNHETGSIQGAVDSISTLHEIDKGRLLDIYDDYLEDGKQAQERIIEQTIV